MGANSGSSPLTRGKHLRTLGVCLDAGLIPAHAGKTNEPTAHVATNPAHPRSRGENALASTLAASVGGSSPLTRGKRRRPHAHPQRRRLIPAHAGKTGCPPGRSGSPLGSSPLTRGKLEGGLAVLGGQRLIPAHAGKTPARSTPLSHSWAHPRSRGENSGIVSHASDALGSSPLTRGKLTFFSCLRIETGLIPAHAGKTSIRTGVPRPRRAHPRSRGENWGSRAAAS